MPGKHTTDSNFKDYRKYGLLKHKGVYLFKGSKGNFLVYDYDSPNPNDWKFPYKIRKASESGPYCVKFDNLSLIKDIVDFMEGKSKELPKGAMKVFLKKKLGGPRQKVFAYKGQVITASNKEDAIQKVIADSKKPKIDMKVVNKWMKKNLDVTDKGLGKDHWKDEKTGVVCYSWDAAKRIAKKVPGYHLPTAKEWDELANACGCRDLYGKESEGSMKVFDRCQNLRKLLKINLGASVDAGTGYFTYGRIGIGFWTDTSINKSRALFKVFNKPQVMEAHPYYKYDGWLVRLVKD